MVKIKGAVKIVKQLFNPAPTDYIIALVNTDFVAKDIRSVLW